MCLYGNTGVAVAMCVCLCGTLFVCVICCGVDVDVGYYIHPLEYV